MTDKRMIVVDECWHCKKLFGCKLMLNYESVPEIIPDSCPLLKLPSVTKADFDELILKVGDISDSVIFTSLMRDWLKSKGMEVCDD